jgi:hypothetical protein
MIAKGNRHSTGSKLAQYLITGKDGERVELAELRGFESGNIHEAFRHVHVMADSTRCTRPFFHVQVRNPAGEDLTPEQRTRIVNRIESKLGLSGQPRAVALHIDQETGDTHIHVAWSLIDENTLKARPLPFFKMRLKEACRELEFKLALTPVRNERETEIKFAPTKAEDEQARRLGLDAHQIRETIRACYDRSDCGPSFKEALAQDGLILAQGDRRDYLVIDEAGGLHALGKKILGATAAQVRAKLSGLDHAQLPTLEQAREKLLTAELHQVKMEIEAVQLPAPVWDRDAANRKWEEAVINAAIEKGNTGGGHDNTQEIRRQDHIPASVERTGPTAQIHDARQHSDNARAFMAALAEHGIGLARATRADAVQSQLDSAEATIAGRWKPTFNECEIVAVTRRGRAWKLSERTTGDKGIQNFLTGLDMPLSSISDIQHERQRERELEAARAEQAQPELTKTSASIRLAYNLAPGPEAFRELLEQRGLTAARVTAQDIQERDSARRQESRFGAIRAWDRAEPELLGPEQNRPAIPEAEQRSGRLSDHAREGDIVILDRWGKSYELNRRSTGDTRQDAQAFVAGIGPFLPSLSAARRELEEKRPVRVPTGPLHAGLVAQQMWALRRLQNADQWRCGPEPRRAEERYAQEAASKATGEVDPQRYLTDPDYRRQVKADRAYKSPEERKAARENELRALLEQQDRQR